VLSTPLTNPTVVIIVRVVSTTLNPTRLKEWRQHEGLSLGELSGLTGLSVPMLSRGERGERNFAPLTKVRIARCLGVPVQTLFEVDPIEEDDPFRKS
jgi:transcriptional regulator with XRE-family HTH domain